MTEEQMLSHQSKSTTWYSGLCTECLSDFYTKRCSDKLCSRICFAKTMQGPRNPTWKGGCRMQRPDGYIILTYYKGHPSASKRGHLLEHILVMETFLGRTLLPNETVHHKNGIRSDNRIDNLELWTTWQPSGQRVEDLLSFVVKNYASKLRTML